MMRFFSKGGSMTRVGHWVVPAAIEAAVTGGNLKLDFTEATITQPELAIEADVHGGNMILITKPGILVDVDDVAVHGGNMKFGKGTDQPAPVVLRIQVSGKVRGGNLVVRLPRRTLWQWLSREPRRYSGAR